MATIPPSTALAAVPGPSGVAATPSNHAEWSHPSGIVPQLQNVVSTVNLKCALDLASIAQRARNAEYNPKRFAACIVRIKDPKTTALMFNSGKMVIAGAKSEEQSRLAARKYTRILQKLGYQVTFSEFTVQNMVASCSVNFPIRLEGLAAKFDMFCNYEPEVFPGLVFRMKKPKLVLLIFVTGKIVLTGAKRVEQIYDAFDNIHPVLLEFRKDDARRIARTPGTASTLQQGTPALPGIADSPMVPLDEAGVPRVPSHMLQAGGSSAMIPPPTVPSMLPPPTPATAMIPAPTPANAPPPPTPAGSSLPPPTPAAGIAIPPPTPAVQIPATPATGIFIPPPTPAVSIPAATPASMVPPPTPATSVPPP